MKKRIMLAISVMLVLGLTIAVFAYNTTPSSSKTTMNCCSKDKDSCPMKNQNQSADKQNAASCCDMPDCCCKGGGNSCPMKKQTETSVQTVDMQNVTVVTSGENCCQPGADCCKNGGSACCKKKS